MLDIRPNCERCDCDLSPEQKNAYICSFECTYCENCATEALNLICPNCQGKLVNRPTRVGEALMNNPASTKRIVKV